MRAEVVRATRSPFHQPPPTMATQSDVRRIALALDGAEEAPDRFAFSVRRAGKPKGFAWVWLERTAPRRARVPNPAVLAVRVANVAQRDLMIAAEPAKFFTEPHYDGYPAVLVRLDAVSVADLETLLAEAWRCQTSPPRAPRAPRRR